MRGTLVTTSITIYEDQLKLLEAEAELSHEGKRSRLVRKILAWYFEKKDAEAKKPN